MIMLMPTFTYACYTYKHVVMNMKYRTGMIVEGKVTGIQPYGAFISLDHNTSGLIHISEISDGFVKDIESFVKVGETVKVKIIDFDQKTRQAKLSLKALHRPHARNRRRQYTHYKASLPSMRIGFHSIATHMDEWIAEAEKDILNQ